jgi:hypothetical protein
MERIERIEDFFRGELPPTPGAPGPVARATQLTRFFDEHYVHAIPFDHGLLTQAWSGCRGNLGSSASCEQARMRELGRLGRFELPDAPLVDGEPRR